MPKHFKMSAWKFGIFQLVSLSYNFNYRNSNYSNFAVDMVTFDSAYNASSIPRNMKVSLYLRPKNSKQIN